MLKVHSRFQLEAVKLGRTVVFQVTVFERVTKNKRSLYAETQCSDPIHFILQFIVRDAPDMDTLLQRFIEELEFRGFEAVRYRLREDKKWGEWRSLLGTGEREAASTAKDDSFSATEG